MCPLVHLRKLSSVTVGALQMSEMRVLCQYTNFSLVVVLVCCVQEHVQQQAVWQESVRASPRPWADFASWSGCRLRTLAARTHTHARTKNRRQRYAFSEPLHPTQPLQLTEPLQRNGVRLLRMSSTPQVHANGSRVWWHVRFAIFTWYCKDGGRMRILCVTSMGYKNCCSRRFGAHSAFASACSVETE